MAEGGDVKETEAAASDSRAAKRAALKAAEEFLRRVAAGESGVAEPSSACPTLYDPSGSVAPPPERRTEGGLHAAQYEAAAGAAISVLPGDDSLWEQKRPTQEAATADEDFDQYFEGLFL